MGLFDILKAGIGKTKESFSQKMEDVFHIFKKVDEELFDELEEALIMADVGATTAAQIIDKLRAEAKRLHITEAQLLRNSLCDIIEQMLSKNRIQKKEATLRIIFIIGVNGVGKTTTIGKLAHLYQRQGKKVLVAAGDTFRAAAIDQLTIWAQRAGVDIIKQSEGSDPAAIIFDAVNAAQSRGHHILICDTAGRLHNKKNLMAELQKMLKVAANLAPDAEKEVLLILDATTGQNALSQAKLFGEVADITGIVLTKIDGTAKGGVIIAIGNEQNIPVEYIGIGEGMHDLQEFSPKDFVLALFSDEKEE